MVKPLSKAEYVPAIGEQFNATWKRGTVYKNFDLKFFTDKSHFQHDIALQSCYYAINGAGRDCNYREMIGWPKDKHLIGDSVDGDETVIVRRRDEKIFKHMKIKDFFNIDENESKEKVWKEGKSFLCHNHNKERVYNSGHMIRKMKNWQVLTIDREMKVAWKDCHAIRHKVKKPSIEIETIGGRRIKITPDHSIIQLRDVDTFKSVAGSDLVEGDYILSYDKLELNEQDVNEFNLEIDFFNKKERFKIFITDLELKIMGYLIGDGYVSEKSQVIGMSGIQEENLRKLWDDFANKYNCKTYYNENMKYDSEIGSTKINQAFKQLGLNGDCYTKQIPDWILNLPKQKLGYFLNGYFSADGSIIIQNNEIFSIELSSVSKKLVEDTKLALSKLGIKYNCGYIKENKMNMNNKNYKTAEAFTLAIYDFESINLFKKYIGFTHEDKQKKLLNGKIALKKRSNQGNLPCQLVKDYCWFYNQKYIDKKRVNHKISNSDIGCYVIKNIRKGQFDDEYVYDLSVNEVNRFLCSGVLVHNSAGFQLASFKAKGVKCDIQPIDSLRWQEDNVDIGFNLDFPPTLEYETDYQDFMKALNESVENFELFERERKNYNMKLYNVLHGNNIKLMEVWYDKVKHFKFDGWGIGIQPPSDPMLQALGFLFLYEKGECEKYGIHFFGVSGKHVAPVMVYIANKLKCKVTYDSSSYNIGSIYRTYYLPFDIGPSLSFGEKFKHKNPYIKQLPCICPVCQSIDNIELLNGTDIYAGTLLSLHNMYQYVKYNSILNSLVVDKPLFIEYLKTINISDRALKAIEFIDFALEKGLYNAIDVFKKELESQELNTSRQVNIFSF